MVVVMNPEWYWVARPHTAVTEKYAFLVRPENAPCHSMVVPILKNTNALVNWKYVFR